MLVLELCGTPGCGKSYLNNILYKHLIEKGYTVCKVAIGKETVYSSFLEKVIKKLKLRYDLYFSPKLTNEREILKKHISENNISQYSYSFYKTILIEILEIKKKHNKEIDVLILSEGIVQALTSLSHGKMMREECLELITCIDENVYGRYDIQLFLCDLDLSENIVRLKNRAKQNDRFLFDDEETMQKALSLKRENIEYVYEHIKNANKGRINTLDANSAVDCIIKKMEEKLDVSDEKSV